ncbi:hypothetical protein ETH_00002150, partial [Eimeria tenella]
REYCVVIDDKTGSISIYPCSRLSFFLQETPEQRAKDFYALQREEMQRGSDGLRVSLHCRSLSLRSLLEVGCHLSPQELKYTNQARLQLQQTGSWVAAAFAARAVPVTEGQIEVSRHLARSAAKPIRSRSEFESFFTKAASSSTAAAAAVAAAAAAAHGIPAALLRKAHAAATAAEAAVISLQEGICSKEIFEEEILPEILRSYYFKSHPLLSSCYITARNAYAALQQDEQKARNKSRVITGGSIRDPSAGLSSTALLKQFSECKDAAAASGPAAAAAAAGVGAAAAAAPPQMLQQMLPRFNPKATCVEELFCLDDLVPLQLLQDGSAQTGTAAAPVLLLLQQQQLDPQQQQQQRQLAHWGEFVAAAAKHAALQKQVGVGSHLSKQLTLQQLARLLKILKFLCVLLKKQKRSFSSQQDLARQLRVGPEPPGHAVTAWLQTEFLKKGFDEKYSMPKEYQTKYC